MNELLPNDESAFEKYDSDLFGATIDENPNRMPHKASREENGDEEVDVFLDWDFSTNVIVESPMCTHPGAMVLDNVTAYSQLRKQFELVCNLAVTPFQISELKHIMDFAHERMGAMGATHDGVESKSLARELDFDGDMSDKEESENHHTTTTVHGLKSFSSISKQLKRRRIRAPYSPEKNK